MNTAEFSRSHRRKMAGCAVFFAAMAVANGFLLPLDDDAAKKPIAIALMVGFWLCWLLTSLYGVIESRSTRFTYSNDRVARVGPFGRCKIALQDMIEVRWRGVSSNASVVLKTSDRKLTLPLSQLTRDDSLGFIECIRDAVPESLQENWPEFCARVALPWRQAKSISELSKEDVADQRRNRTRVHVLFGAMTLSYLLIGGWCWWQTRDLRAWIGLGVLVLFWIPVWYLAGQKKRHKTRQLEADMTPFTILIAICFGLVGLGCLLTAMFDWPALVMVATCMVALAGYVFGLLKVARIQQSSLQTRSAQAVVDWDSSQLPCDSRLSNT